MTGTEPRRAVPRGVIGMVHLAPLPGAPRWAGSMEAVTDRAQADARALADGGVDAVLVENYGDLPFAGGRLAVETVAALSVAVAVVRAAVDLPVGVNALRNDAAAALAVAAATGARFIRVNVHTGGMHTDQGWIEGRAADTLRLRARICPDVAILADVLVKHATPPPGLGLEEAARDAWERGLADALVVSGAGTGETTSLPDVRHVAERLPDACVLVGSGVTAETIGEVLAVADGAIVGSSLQRTGAGSAVDLARVRRLVDAARSGRARG